ncbi:hypothetical protein HYS47_02855 [Candidatus Woesearchaeota archaeon]|nr:hypothetical protein [Candidatus Woesearchaeota archaeon]
MGKRGVLIGATALVVSVLLLLMVAAQHSAVVTLSSLSMYETTTAPFNVSINNFGSQDSINLVTAQLGGFTVKNVTGYSDWKNNFTANSIQWFGGLIHNNVINALFQFLAAAPAVDSNQTYTFTFVTKDTSNAEQTHSLQFTILNDETGPILSNQTVSDGSFIRQGANAYLVSTTAVDAETGVSSVTFRYSVCNDPNSTATTIQLTPSGSAGSAYSATVDFSAVLNEKQVCFDYIAASKGGASTTYSGKATIDGVPPTVSLKSPAEGAFINGQASFTFVPSDNLAPSLSCSLLIDDVITTTQPVSNNAVGSFSAQNGTDGKHTWNVQCADGVGLSGKGSSRTFTLDKTPPAAVLTSPSNNSIISAGTLVEGTVADDYGVQSVMIAYNGNSTPAGTSFSISTASWTDGPTTIVITATDNAGNTGTTILSVTVDRTPPVIALTGPEGTSDVHVNFTYNADDAHDDTLSCELYVNDTLYQAKDVIRGSNSFTQTLSPSSILWRVDCTDSANNRGSSTPKSLTIVDTSGPDIVVTPVDSIARGNPILVTANITDPSGVAKVTASVVGPDGGTTPVTPVKSGSTYTVSYPTTNVSKLGTYTVAFSAEDTLGYGKSATEELTLTYAYLVTLTLTPTSVAPGDEVTASGKVVRDDGTLVPEQKIKLALPDDSLTVTLDPSNGAFTTTFIAPLSSGTYNVTAGLTSLENNMEYSSTASFTVSSGSSGGSTAGESFHPGSGGFGDLSSNYQPPQSPGTTTAIAPAVVEDVPSTTSSGSQSAQTPDTTSDVQGVGAATGFFSLENLKNNTLWWALLLFIIVIAALTMASKRSRGGTLGGNQRQAAKPKQLRKVYQSFDEGQSLGDYLDSRTRPQ